MATIRLIPSEYAVSSTSYLSVSNASNMYTNTDSTTYATIQNTNASTNSRYLYIRGFNFDDIPSNATINSFTVKIKGYESGLATGTNYAPRLANGTSALSNTTASTNFGTTATTITIPTGALTWQQIINYGSSFTILVYVRRNNRNTTGYFYCYGAEILVDYTVPTSATITSSLTGNGTISPSGTTNTYEGETYTLTITPDDKTDILTITKDGVDVTADAVGHGAGGTVSTVLGEYTLVSGSFSTYASGESYFEGIVGNGSDASTTTSNYYSSSSDTTAVFTYDMSFNLPSDAQIERVYCQVSGHAESTSNSDEYMCAQLKSGSTYLSEQYNFKNSGSTSNSIQTIECTTLPTVAQLQNMVLECTLGYYGGAINGATCYVEYSVVDDEVQYYTYSFEVTGNSTINVTLAPAGPQNTMFVKNGNTWKQVSKVYKKINGS